MPHELKIHLNPSVTDAALRRFIISGIEPLSLVAAGGCLAFLIYDLLDQKLGLYGLGILCGLGLMGILYAVAYVVRRSRSQDLLRRLDGEPIVYHFNERDIQAGSSLGGSSFLWKEIFRVWVYEDVIMLFYARNGYLTLPTAQVSREVQDFIFEKVRASGGQVRKRIN